MPKIILHIEYVFGIQEEFFFDYESEKLFFSNDSKWEKVIYHEEVDKSHPKIKIDKVYRSLNSFGEAFVQLNKRAQQLKEKLLKEKTNVIDFPKDNNKLMSV